MPFLYMYMENFVDDIFVLWTGSEDAMETGTKLKREDFRQGRTISKDSRDRISFISIYDNDSNIIKKAIRNAWHGESKYGRLFCEFPRFIYRKEKNWKCFGSFRLTGEE